MYFSERNKLKPQKEIVLGNLDRTCKNRLWNCIYDIYRRNGYDSLEIKKSLNYVLDKVGEKYTYSSLLGSLFGQTVEDGVKRLEQVWENSEWYCEFDIIETILETKIDVTYSDDEIPIPQLFNTIFEEEKSGYRIIDNMIIAITDPVELEEIEESLNIPFDIVDESLTKALRFYSDRESPDYKNSIKESITAVESMCKIICDDDSLVLGRALGKLESKGIYIHSAMKEGFKKLYGYTSDANGIRHGGIDESKVMAEDAKYMLVTCSAFVNYLKEKYLKTQGEYDGKD